MSLHICNMHYPLTSSGASWSGKGAERVAESYAVRRSHLGVETHRVDDLDNVLRRAIRR